MLLNELYSQRDEQDLAAHARDVIRRLERTGARDAGHGPELNHLQELVAEYEQERESEADSSRRINSGQDSAIGYIAKQIHQQIDHLAYQIKASTGAGGMNKDRREHWNAKQEADPLSREIRQSRLSLKDERY